MENRITVHNFGYFDRETTINVNHIVSIDQANGGRANIELITGRFLKTSESYSTVFDLINGCY